MKSLREFFVRVVMFAMSISMLVFVQAAQFSSVEVDGSTVRLVGVEPGFTFWNFWDNFSSPEICSWVEFRQTISVMNPQFVANDFTQIPVGATLNAPKECLHGPLFPSAVQPIIAESIVYEPTVLTYEPQALASPIVNQITIELGTQSIPLTGPAGVDASNGSSSLVDANPLPLDQPPLSTWWSTILNWGYWFYVALTLFGVSLLLLFLWRRDRSALQDDIDDSRELIQAFAAESVEFKKDRGKHVHHVTALEGENVALRGNNDLLKEKLDEKELRIYEMRKEIEERDIRITELISQRNSANSRYGAAKRELEKSGQSQPESASSTSKNNRSRGGRRQKRAMNSRVKKTDQEDS